VSPPDQLALLRGIVAALGERATPPWWRTQFLTEAGLRTIARIVPRTAVSAAVDSTAVAAGAEHDRWIGVGQRQHLFRLPSSLELRIGVALRADSIQSKLRAWLIGREGLLEGLTTLSSSTVRASAEGPIALGHARQLSSPASVAKLASCYLTAFKAGNRTYPYFEEEAA
jgi:hypothetical protein